MANSAGPLIQNVRQVRRRVPWWRGGRLRGELPVMNIAPRKQPESWRGRRPPKTARAWRRRTACLQLPWAGALIGTARAVGSGPRLGRDDPSHRQECDGQRLISPNQSLDRTCSRIGNSGSFRVFCVFRGSTILSFWSARRSVWSLS